MATSRLHEIQLHHDAICRIPLVTRLREMRTNGKYTDITLISGDVHLPCHRVVLQAASPYFTALFSSGLEDGLPATAKMSIDPVTLNDIIDYIYGSDVYITTSNAESLVETSDFLMLEDLKNRCHKFLVGQVEPCNCVRFYWFAKLYSLSALQDRTRRVMLEDFKAVATTVEFKEMPFSQLVEYISDDAVSGQGEHLVLGAVQGWMDHDRQNRLSSLQAIYEHVNRLMFSSMQRLMVVFGKNIRNCTNCEYLNADGDRWQVLSSFPHSLDAGSSVCQVKDGLLLTGLYRNNLRQCWLFDTICNSWTTTAGLIYPRHFHSSVALNDAAYVLGGLDDNNKLLASVERFDLRLRHWTVLPDMAEALAQVMVTGHGDYVYTMGGRPAKDATSRRFHRYNTKSGIWRRLADMPKPLRHGAVAALNGYIYVVGGDSNFCHQYDPTTNTWSELQKPRQQHIFAAAIEWHGRILLAGGANGNDELTSVIEQYDPFTDKWSTWDIQLPQQMKRHSLFKLNILPDSSTLMAAQDRFCCTFNERVVKLRDDGLCIDVTLVTDDVRIACHRVVLAASCEYFNALFSSDLVDATSDTIQLRVDPLTLTNVVDYIYNDDVDIRADNVQNLVIACDVLLLDHLKGVCQRFMIRHLQPSNILEYYRFARFYGLENLRVSAIQMMYNMFDQIVPTAEFAELTCSELIDYISDDKINVPDEDAVMEAVLVWARHDLDNRQSDLPMILRHVRLYYCSTYYLSRLLKDRTFLTTQCGDFLEDALSWQGVVGPRAHHVINHHADARAGFTIRRLLVVVGGLTKAVKTSQDCLKFVPGSSFVATSWTAVTQVPEDAGKFYSVCATTGGLLLSGTGLIWFYNVFKKKWEGKGYLKTPRFHHASVPVDNAVYILGGTNDNLTVLKSVERLNKTCYTYRAVMLEPVTHPMAACHGHNLYVFGGIKADNTTSRCSRIYNTRSNEWRLLAELPEECRLGAVVAGIDCMYIVGGSTRSCLHYQLTTGAWTRLRRPSNVHSYAPAVGWNNRILLAGGENSEQEATSGVEQYDLEKDEWTEWRTPLTQKLSGHHLLSVVFYTSGSLDSIDKASWIPYVEEPMCTP